MIIGVDFDNTIAKYDSTFKKIAIKKKYIFKNWQGKSKEELKKHILKKNNGSNKWMTLQGLVYGKYMQDAELYPNVINFLKLTKDKKHQLYIISHKTEFGHFDKSKISLRRQALKWMKSKGFFNPKIVGLNIKNIFFTNTRDQKIKTIKTLKCDWFIDDLEIVLKNKNFPPKTKKILFGNKNKKINKMENLSNWEEIIEKILGAVNLKDIKNLINSFYSIKINSIKKINRGGNSRIYKFTSSKNNSYAIKYYPDLLLDNRPRLNNEFFSLQFLNKNRINYIPKAIKKNENLNIAIYEWIKGYSILRPSRDDLIQAINFIIHLNKLAKKTNFKKINFASEACLSAEQLILQVEKRMLKLKKIQNNEPKLKKFLEKTFYPLWNIIRKKSLKKWPKNNIYKNLNKNYLTLSPSDFGFHNAIKSKKKIFFFDFEYFGWDDPVKLTADFLWHPSFQLSNKLNNLWISEMSKIYQNDTNFQSRLLASMPVYGMRWAMIILNVFLPEFIQKRKKTSNIDFNKLKILQNSQLSKAIKYCKIVESNINNFNGI